MSVFDPAQTESDDEPAREPEEPSFPTKFGRDRHRLRPWPAGAREPGAPSDDEPPFADHGGL
jgi:hypothetical protein